jgi:uncharacterized protein YceK
MKKLLLLVVFALSGCSTVASLWPKPHDPVMFDQIVAVDVALNKTNCSNKDWGNLLDRVHHLKVYTELRKDPQSQSIAQLEEALLKAYNSKNEKFCDNILTINKTRVQVVEEAWRGR